VKVFSSFFLGALLFANSATAKVFQFIYIDASEGNSSGGHVAVQLGDEVYHYQYEEALIRLFKQNAEAFRVYYQLKQNRSLHSADIEVSEATFERLSRYFKQRFFEQHQHLKQLQTIQQDQALLQALLRWKSGKFITSKQAPELTQRLPGAGLFYDDKIRVTSETLVDCNTISATTLVINWFKQQLNSQYGADFLSQKTNALTTELATLAPIIDTKDSSTHYGFSERYSDLLNGLLALQVVQKNQPLVASACFQLKFPVLALSDADVSQAREFQQDLLHSAQALMVSKRPDWGYALFITLARLVAIEHSIQTRQWTFVDDTDETITPLASQKLALYAEHLQQQRDGDLKRLYEVITNLGMYSSVYERHYLALEMAANRYQQWLVSDKSGMLRYRSEQPLPKKTIAVSRFLMTDLSAQQLAIALRDQQKLNQHLIEDDNKRNAYHLLTNNCVTALFELIDKALAGQSKQHLGGFIDPKSNFIPFQAYDTVQETYKVVSTKTLPAYRQQALAKMYDREIDSLVYARESNIFSSSVYSYNPDDAWFVFFTDDALLLRPLFGAVNTLAATSQSVWGLMSWPFDEGRAIKTGVRGVMASLPEFAFFNIRKGSYPYPIQKP